MMELSLLIKNINFMRALALIHDMTHQVNNKHEQLETRNYYF